MSTRPLLRLVPLLTALLLTSCDSLVGPGDEIGPRFSPTPLRVAGDLTFVSLTAGWQHTCGLTTGGTAYCWGDNGVGQLGDGAGGEFLDHSAVPVKVAGNHAFVSIAAGGDAATCGLTAEGTLYCWGGFGPHCENGSGCKTTPTRLTDAPAFAAVGLAGWENLCGRTGAGEVYCQRGWENGFARAALPAVNSIHIWGFASSGEWYPCGLTAEGEAHCAGPTGGRVAGGYRFASLSTGAGHACGITEGTAYCWGGNDVGQLGRGFWHNWYTDYSSEPREFSTPEPVQGKPALSSIAAGFSHSCGLTPQGVAYCWGANGGGTDVDGRLGSSRATTCNIVTWNGRTSSDPCSPSPSQVSGDITFASLTVGGMHTCALTAMGHAYCWGRNTLGQLGMGQSTCKRHSDGTVSCG